MIILKGNSSMIHSHKITTTRGTPKRLTVQPISTKKRWFNIGVLKQTNKFLREYNYFLKYMIMLKKFHHFYTHRTPTRPTRLEIGWPQSPTMQTPSPCPIHRRTGNVVFLSWTLPYILSCLFCCHPGYQIKLMDKINYRINSRIYNVPFKPRKTNMLKRNHTFLYHYCK